MAATLEGVKLGFFVNPKLECEFSWSVEELSLSTVDGEPGSEPLAPDDDRDRADHCGCELAKFDDLFVTDGGDCEVWLRFTQ